MVNRVNLGGSAWHLPDATEALGMRRRLTQGLRGKGVPAPRLQGGRTSPRPPQFRWASWPEALSKLPSNGVC